MKLRNFFISLLMLILVIYGAVKAWMYFEAKHILDDMVAGMNRYGINVTYDRIATSIIGTVGVQGLKFYIPQLNEDIRFGEVTIYAQDFKRDENKIPTRMHFTMEKIQFSLDLLDKIGATPDKGIVDEIIDELGYGEMNQRRNNLRRLGYNNIVMDLSIDAQFHPALGESTGYIDMDVENMGDFKFYTNLSNIKFTSRLSYLDIKLKEFRLDYVDHSYVDRIIKSFADDSGMDMEVYRSQLLSKIDADIATKQIKLNPESIQN